MPVTHSCVPPQLGDAFLFMPKDCDALDAVMVDWLREFAWTEAEQPRRMRERSERVPADSNGRAVLDNDPM